MAVTVARVHLAMANAALPGLLPTPPKSAMMPSPAASCIPILLPAKSPSNKTMPGRADAVERWDAHKTKPGGSASTSSSGSSSPRSTSPGRASSCERWDSNKSTTTSSSLSSASSRQRRDSSSKRPAPVSRASSAGERWDLHKKPRALQVAGGKPQAMYAGPGFLASPEPCMLPVPTFMVRAR